MLKKIIKTSFAVLICLSIIIICYGEKIKTGTSSAPVSKPVIAAALQNKTNDKPLRFIVMADSRGTDNGVNSKIVDKTMLQIKQLSPQPQFIIMPGDLIDGAKSFAAVKKQLLYFKKLVTKYYPADIFYPGIGNHEMSNGVNGEKALSEVFPEFKAVFLKDYNRSVYYFDKGDSRFFMLNTNHPGRMGTISDTQRNWVKDNVKPDSAHNFYFLHQPAYPTGSHVGSSLDVNPLQRDMLWQVIDQSADPMVFCGHEHFYTRRHIDSSFNETVKNTAFKYTKSVYQITVGSFGAPLYSKFVSKKNVDVPPVSQYHFAVVDVLNGIVSVNVYDVNGKLIDSFGAVK